jgi:hypothetical protein
MKWATPDWWTPGSGLSSRILHRDDYYDIDEWGEWLDTHGLDNNDVYQIDFNDDKTEMMVYQYRRNRKGRKYVTRRTGGVARRWPQHYRTTSPPPSWRPRV